MADKKYFICEGKALTTKKGIQGEGVELTPEMVNGGKEQLERLAKANLITTKAPVEEKTEKAEEKK